MFHGDCRSLLSRSSPSSWFGGARRGDVFISLNEFSYLLFHGWTHSYVANSCRHFHFSCCVRACTETIQSAASKSRMHTRGIHVLSVRGWRNLAGSCLDFRRRELRCLPVVWIRPLQLPACILRSDASVSDERDQRWRVPEHAKCPDRQQLLPLHEARYQLLII